MSRPSPANLPLRVITSNGLLVILSVVITLGGLEVALQIREALFYGQTAAQQERLAATQDANFRLHRRSQDPIMNYELRPHAVVKRGGIIYRTNGQGLRDDEDVPPKPTGERRIVILGDSVAFGLGVEQERTFAQLIENRLNEAGPPTRILNLSVLGYKTAQEVRLFEHKGWVLEPDGVVVALCLNDFDDYSGELPLFDPSFSSPAGSGYRRVPPRRIGSIELPDHIPLLDRSLLFRKITVRLLQLDYYRWIGTNPELRAQVAMSINQLGHELSERGIPHLLVIFPILVDGTYPYEDLHWFVSQQAKAAGFVVVDLLDGFSTKSLSEFRLRPNDLLHLNNRGHAVTARVLAPCLADPIFHCS